MVVHTSFEEAIATVTLDRPEARNALSIEMCNDVVDALRIVDRDDDARVVVFKGAGSVFTAGADLAAVTADPAAFLHAFETMLVAVERHRLPTIAALHGAALGGGLQLATVCDFRLASERATIGIPSARLGIVVNFENVERLVLMVGIAGAKQILMTGRSLTAAEALHLGLVTEVFDPGGFDAEVQRFARDIGALAPLSVQGAKRAIQAVVDHVGSTRRADPMKAEEIDRLVAEAYASDDLREGLRALSGKIEPRFRGT